MKRFSFRFQILLDAKTWLEEARRNELGLLMQKHREEEKRLFEIEKKIQDSLNDFVFIESGNIEDISKHRNYLERLNNEKLLQIEVVKKRLNDVEAKRVEIIALEKEKIALEKIRNKDYKKYIDEMNLEERNMMDEVAASRYIKNAAEEIRNKVIV